MFRSYRVGTIYGIPFRLDITFLFILPVFAWLIGTQLGEAVVVLNQAFELTIDPAAVTSGMRPWIIGFVSAIALFTCVTLHELGHSVVAMAYGYEIDSITLWLLGGIAKPAEVPKNWVHEFWIAVAGPVVNVSIIALCGIAMLVIPPIDVLIFLVLYLAVLNAALAIFNLLPAFPLDGGRILRALLARQQSYVRATRQAAAVGKVFAVLLGVLGLITLDVILVAVALFVYIAATSESRQMMLDAAFTGVAINEVMTPTEELATVEADVKLSHLLNIMLEERHIGYPVLDGGEFVGMVTLSDVKSVEKTEGDVQGAMTPLPELTTVRPDTEVMDAFKALSESDIGRLPVVGHDGSLAGIVTRTDLMRAFSIVLEQERFEEGAVSEAI